MIETAVYAAGCFWCYEPIFKSLRGVLDVEVGYTGGVFENPTSDDIYSGITGHAESFRITFDSDLIPYKKLLEVFFYVHDPTSLNKQGNDIGDMYRSEIFYIDESQKIIAEDMIQDISDNYTKPIVTKVSELGEFYLAENYHQEFYNSNRTSPYCMFVIDPKIEKFSEKFKDLLQDQ